jgi:hypothetical protein
MKYAIEMDTGATIYALSFIQIPKLTGGGGTDALTHTHSYSIETE